jgi:hypothetical protein
MGKSATSPSTFPPASNTTERTSLGMITTATLRSVLLLCGGRARVTVPGCHLELRPPLASWRSASGITRRSPDPKEHLALAPAGRERHGCERVQRRLSSSVAAGGRVELRTTAPPLSAARMPLHPGTTGVARCASSGGTSQAADLPGPADLAVIRAAPAASAIVEHPRRLGCADRQVNVRTTSGAFGGRRGLDAERDGVLREPAQGT